MFGIMWLEKGEVIHFRAALGPFNHLNTCRNSCTGIAVVHLNTRKLFEKYLALEAKSPSLRTGGSR